tara:strand:- start:1366 stop:1797 length:432 start_codon:yes stop_codon:yes gene_type:complete
MKLLNRKLTLKKDYDCICEINTFSPSSSTKRGGVYEINLPSIGKLSLDESQINTLFDLIEEEPKVKLSEFNSPTPANKEVTEEVASDNLQERRRELLSSKKDALLAIIAEMSLEDEIAGSLKKALLVEEILKEAFGEDYKAEG